MRALLFGGTSSESAGRQIGWTGATLFAAAIGVWAAVYFSGAWPWLGYASMSKSTVSIGPIGIVGEDSTGDGYGLTDFIYLKGQEIVIEYDAEIRAGSLSFHVFQPFDGRLGDGVMHYVTESGAGTWTWRVPATGIYTVLIGASVARGAGRGYDISYSAWWGARRPG
jgi:hypothetical protein